MSVTRTVAMSIYRAFFLGDFLAAVFTGWSKKWDVFSGLSVPNNRRLNYVTSLMEHVTNLD